MKTSELNGAALDWAVAKCEGLNPPIVNGSMDIGDCPDYSTDWDQGGPIIEREWLDITPWPNESDEEIRWQCNQHDVSDCCYYGPTPLIAAMRCYVASKLGDEIEVPEALL